MERAKKVQSIERNKDLISHLPCNVIDCIMDQLPIHDSARMAVMSRKWRDIWKSLAYLKFDVRFFENVLNKYPVLGNTRFFFIVSRVLLSHRGPITHFFLHIPNKNSESPDIGSLFNLGSDISSFFNLSSDIGSFLNFLSINGVREITIENGRSSSFTLPSDLFSCTELNSLKLDCCTIKVPSTFISFMKLIRLELASVRFMGNTFENFISSCPMLENLILNGLSTVDHPIINAPNLKHLEVLGTFKSLTLKSCHGLLSTEIGLLRNKVACNHDSRTCDLLHFLSGSCKLQKLNIKGNFIEYLAAPCCWEIHNRTFKELQLLQLSNLNFKNTFQFFFACSIIQSCPILEELTMSFRTNTCPIEFKVDCDASYKLERLRKLCIYSVNGVTQELNLIKFLLSSSPALEKVYVKVNPKTTPDLRWTLQKALIRFPRASAKAEIVLMD